MLFDNLTREQLHAYCLVLDAYRLPYTAETTRQGGRIMVERYVYTFAYDLVQKYIEENPEPPMVGPEASDLPQSVKTWSAAWICLLLLIIHLLVHHSRNMDQVIADYGASASRIMAGDLYRAATALLLHADLSHLLGNLAALALLGTMTCALVGPGVGWLMILLSGIAGNLTNALFFQHSHVSIGASTAVFGAMGILAAYQFHRKRQSPHSDQRRKAWLPLAGALALLGFMGTGERSDIMAHLFGLLSGGILGTIYLRYLGQRILEKHQLVSFLLAAAIVVLSWLGPITSP